MKHFFKILFLFLFPALAYSQGGTWPVKYNDSDPSGAPSAAGTRIYFNTATNTLWFWEPAPSSQWRKQPKAFDQVSGCAAPAYTPTARQSTFAVNSCTPKPELYQWTGSAWALLNPATLYTAGTGISIASGVISNTGDLSSTNELNVALYVEGGSLKLDDEQTTVSVPLSQFRNGIYSAGTGIAISGGGVVSATDASTTNEIQTLSIAGQNLSLSLGGGTVAIPNIYNTNGVLTGNRTIDADGKEFVINNAGVLTLSSAFLEINAEEGFITGDYFSFAPTSLFEISTASASVGITDGLGLKYVAEYPDILTNDRSIPDVGLTKDLIASENGALGTGFVNGGGSGEIPANTTATLESSTMTLYGGEFFDDDIFSGLGFRGDDGSGNKSYLGIVDNTDDGLQRVMIQSTSPAGNSSILIDGRITNYNTRKFQLIVADEIYMGIEASATTGFRVNDARAAAKGVEYGGDYSATIITNPASFTDVRSVNKLKQTLVSYTTSARNAISSPATGYIIFCTDCTATDASTGVQQTWNGSTWKNAW